MAHSRDRTQFRLFILLVFIFASLVGITTRLVFVQQVEAKKYERMAVGQRLREIELPGERGIIYDRDGRELAINVDAYSVYATPYFIRNPTAVSRTLAPILGIDAAQLRNKLTQKSGFVYLARQVDKSKTNRIRHLKINGVGFIKERKRYYPGEMLAAHVLGFTGIDNQGLNGMELQYDQTLAGRSGKLIVEGDPAGAPIPGGAFSKVSSVKGKDIFLTIDKDIQYKAEVELHKVIKEYTAKGGSIIVINPTTGEILAMANEPSYNPNAFAKSKEAERRNRAVIDTYEPGSTAKIATVVAGLEAGMVRPTDVFYCPSVIEVGGQKFSEYDGEGKGDITVSEIISLSSNVGAVQVGQKVGKTKLCRYFKLLGIGTSTGIDFPGEAQGYVPTPEEWSETTIATLPYGQGLSTTPLQMLMMTAAVANDGVTVTPHLLKESSRIRSSASIRQERAISLEAARMMQAMMVETVERGTGKNAQIAGYEVGGKTGTAQKPGEYGGYEKGKLVLSFIGFVSNKHPQLAIVVTVDEPKPTGRMPLYGGAIAAPVFKNVAEFCIKRLKIPPGDRLL